MKETVRKYTLVNAIRHKGKAEGKSVLSKILTEKSEYKFHIKIFINLVNTTVEDVNSISIEQQKKEVSKKYPNLLTINHKETKKKTLPPLPNAIKYKKIVTRFSPNPDCVLHIGSLRAALLSDEYAKMYRGTFILRFEDTDPRLKKSSLEFYEAIREDLNWLGCQWSEEFIQSNRICIYYDYASKLIEVNGAYVCICKREDSKTKLLKGLSCPCRLQSKSKNLERWNSMLDGGFQEGEAVLRVKTDLKHSNPAIRDWPAFRIINPFVNKHPRVGSKYRVWPLYNFACGVDDHLMNITHIIRGKEHITNATKQSYLYGYFGWQYPESIHYGRLRMEDTDLSKSKILLKVITKEVDGFDDPRLPTLKALRRRGISPETLRDLIIEIGPKPVDANLSWENIYAHNRRILEPKSRRYFYVEDPILLKVTGIKKAITTKIPFHPSQPTMGERIIKITPKPENYVLLLISSRDRELIQSSESFRLIGLFNATYKKIEKDTMIASFESRQYKATGNRKIPLVQWVNEESNIDVKITLPSAVVSKGKGERELLNTSVGDTIQFIRFGFTRVDKIADTKIDLFYTHS